MTGADAKADLHRYLQAAREALLWKLDGLAEYDIRRPLTPTVQLRRSDSDTGWERAGGRREAQGCCAGG